MFKIIILLFISFQLLYVSSHEEYGDYVKDSAEDGEEFLEQLRDQNERFRSAAESFIDEKLDPLINVDYQEDHETLERNLKARITEIDERHERTRKEIEDKVAEVYADLNMIHGGAQVN